MKNSTLYTIDSHVWYKICVSNVKRLVFSKRLIEKYTLEITRITRRLNHLPAIPHEYLNVSLASCPLIIVSLPEVVIAFPIQSSTCPELHIIRKRSLSRAGPIINSRVTNFLAHVYLARFRTPETYLSILIN
ncbi:hypothetical protein PUN28_011621 [Cardiocondyla obscurior]|uniref:Uncharacterized protein n=1 Tax=Cardiocondyla obscurior TaxID=286306 RepID=A0AAW2FKD5_9HYME